jgi:hypothetical protein
LFFCWLVLCACTVLPCPTTSTTPRLLPGILRQRGGDGSAYPSALYCCAAGRLSLGCSDGTAANAAR